MCQPTRIFPLSHAPAHVSGRAWAVVAAAVLTWAGMLVVSRLLLHDRGLDPWMFSFVQLFSGGLVLVALSRGAHLGNAALRRVDTWLVGVCRVATGALMMAALVHINVMQAGFIGAMNVPMAALAVWIVFSRRPGRAELMAQALLLVGVLVLVASLTGGVRNPAVVLLALSEVAVVGSAILAERHPHNQAADLATRLRLSGIVLLITAGAFVALRGAQVMLGGAATLDLADLADPALWLAGIGVGVVFRGPATYLTFRAVQLAGTQNYTLAVITLPLFGLGLEVVAALAGQSAWPAVGPADAAGAALVMAGGLGVAWARRRPIASADAP